MRPRWGRRWLSAGAFAATLTAALLVAGSQGFDFYQDRTLTPEAQARVGESVGLGGTTFVVQSFVVAPELPAAKPDRADGPVRGPAGSVLVLVVYSQQIDATVDIDRHACTARLVADDGTEWEEEDDLGYSLRRPESFSCGDSDDEPLRVGVAREVGSSFLIPARYADQVRWRLTLAGGDTQADDRAVEFRR